MAARDWEEFGQELLAAKERDLAPLRAESAEVLGLEGGRAQVLDASLDVAWMSGLRSGRDQLEARATEPEPDLQAVAVAHLEADFKGLMERTAEALDLPLPETICMWNLLHRAWMAGNRSGSAELMALYVELDADVAEEARRWLEERGD